MKSFSSFHGLLFAAASSVVIAQCVEPVARSPLDELSVIFINAANLTGVTFAPDEIAPGDCSTLPCRWLGRPESVKIGPGYTCNFYVLVGCAGPSIQLNGTVYQLPADSDPPLNDNIESFSCNKEIDI